MTKIICNYCGKEIDEINESYHTIKLDFGYGSCEHDGEHIHLDFHEACMDKVYSNMIKDCVIKPEANRKWY